MSNKPTHDILLAENYEAGDGEQKAYFGQASLGDVQPIIALKLRRPFGQLAP